MYDWFDEFLVNLQVIVNSVFQQKILIFVAELYYDFVNPILVVTIKNVNFDKAVGIANKSSDIILDAAALRNRPPADEVAQLRREEIEISVVFGRHVIVFIEAVA